VLLVLPGVVPDRVTMMARGVEARLSDALAALPPDADGAAIQNAARKSPANHAIAPTASKGPAIAPTVSSACRRPELAPRASRGLKSAISAARGAPPNPRPSR